MYQVKINGKKPQTKALKVLFKNYEEARNAVRKFLRKVQLGRNLSENGISILKVA